MPCYGTAGAGVLAVYAPCDFDGSGYTVRLLLDDFLQQLEEWFPRAPASVHSQWDDFFVRIACGLDGVSYGVLVVYMLSPALPFAVNMRWLNAWCSLRAIMIYLRRFEGIKS